MTVSAISADFARWAPRTFPVPDASGLAPLVLPEALLRLHEVRATNAARTPPEAIARFKAALEKTDHPTTQPSNRQTIQPSNRQTFPKIADSVARQIAAVPSPADGDGKIVIRLSDSVLDGSEIRLEAKGGVLSVEIVPATPDAEKTIGEGIPQLERALAGRFPAFSGFSISVRKGNEDEAK